MPHDDPARSTTLPGRLYVDPDALARERTALFFRTWHYAGGLSELGQPGDYVTARPLDQNVIVIRGRDGVLRGFHNVCQHRAHELLEGSGNARTIVCPYHAWSYADDGRLLGARGLERQADFDAARFCLKPVRIDVLADALVFFNLDPQATPLSDAAADLDADLRAMLPALPLYRADRIGEPRRIAANWKIVVDNFLECYHCAPAHPAFCDLIDMASYRMTAQGLWSSQKGMLRAGDNAAYPVAADGERRALFWWLFPSTVINVMPGLPEVVVGTILPDGAGHTLRRFQRFAPPGAPRDSGRDAYERETFGPEDVAICESVQRGLRSLGYDRGRIVHDAANPHHGEAAVHHFHRLLMGCLSRP
jgi:carnitine monooxygenase subunit